MVPVMGTSIANFLFAHLPLHELRRGGFVPQHDFTRRQFFVVWLLSEVFGVYIAILEYPREEATVTLIDFIAQGISIAQVVRIALALATCLRNSHAFGFSHQDVKPGNVLMWKSVGLTR